MAQLNRGSRQCGPRFKTVEFTYYILSRISVSVQVSGRSDVAGFRDAGRRGRFRDAATPRISQATKTRNYIIFMRHNRLRATRLARRWGSRRRATGFGLEIILTRIRDNGYYLLLIIIIYLCRTTVGCTVGVCA